MLRKIFSFFAVFSVLASLSADDQAIKVVFLGESSSQDAVWQYRVAQMSEQAKRLNIDFSYRFAEGNYEHHAEMINEAVSSGAQAIIGPWWNQDVYNDAIANALEHDVFVYGLLGIEPKNTLSPHLVDQMGWAETDWKEYGMQLALHAQAYLPDQCRILWPAETAMGNYITDAIEGFMDQYEQQSRLVNIDVIEVGFDAEIAVSSIIDYLSMHPDASAIITSGAIAINAANIAVKKLKLQPDEITLIGQVASPAAVQGIQEGYMKAGVNIELTESSYNALLDVLAVLKMGADPRHGSVGLLTITKDNVAERVPMEFFIK